MPANSISFGNYTAYTPYWSSLGTAPAIGNGVRNGWYLMLSSDLIAVQTHFSFGSTTTYGTSDYLFGFPTGIVSAVNWQAGAAAALNATVVWRTGRSHTFSGVDYVKVAPFNTGSPWSNASPFTFGVGDGIWTSIILKVYTAWY